MSQDFERYWLDKLANCLETVAGEQVRRTVMAGSEGLSDATSREEVVAWSQGAMDRLDGLVDEGAARAPFDDLVSLEEAVRLADRHRVHAELSREGPGRGQLVSGLQQAARDVELHLIHELAVDGHAAVRIDDDQ